jgi:hypothetical protein
MPASVGLASQSPETVTKGPQSAASGAVLEDIRGSTEGNHETNGRSQERYPDAFIHDPVDPRTAKPITRPLKVDELCKAFVLYREGKGLDKATLSEDRYISRRLQKHLGGYMAHELGVAEIRSFLDTAKTSDSLEHKLYKVGSLIFAYGKEQRVLVLNPFDEIDRPKVAYTVPEILEPAQFKTLLETAEEEVPETDSFSCNGGLRRRSAE